MNHPVIAVRVGQWLDLRPHIRRVTANNPSAFTGPGTNSYLLETPKGWAILDPGPRLEQHFDQLVAATEGRPVACVLVTHTHPDHSPLANTVADHFSVPAIGLPAPDTGPQDRKFAPTVQPFDGQQLETCGGQVTAILTPGHASNHVCYWHALSNTVFTGDHINQGSTVVIDPPDGHMGDYLHSLARLLTYDLDAIAPGHGTLIDDPLSAINWLITHRAQREKKVLDALRSTNTPTSLSDLVPAVYDDVDARLFPIAERSLLAHLIHLEELGEARSVERKWQALQGYS
ncbi:MAG: MBL fold metallo-hydrolase [Lysobacteraceae bacterium]|nr:MAG: MBL fold metallo-hydrolase [Xanthomonadaceae bacterium]